MHLGEFIELINDPCLVITVVAEDGSGLDGVTPGDTLYSGEISDFTNCLVDEKNDVYLDEMYVDTIDVDEYGAFTINVC